METEHSIKKENTSPKDRILFIGLMLMIVGTFSFTNYERFGDVLTLIGALVILGSCIWSRWNK